jgi:hypothetical protein
MTRQLGQSGSLAGGLAVALLGSVAAGPSAARTLEDFDVGSRSSSCIEIEASGHRLLRHTGPDELWAFEDGEWTLALRRPTLDDDGVARWQANEGDVDGDRVAWHVSTRAPDGTAVFGTFEIWEFVTGEWTRLDRIAPAEPIDTEGLATPVDLAGDRALMGPRVYDIVGGVWEETGRLPFDSTGLVRDHWGFSDAAIEGTTAVLSVAASAETESGAVQVFESDSGDWVLTARLEDPNTDAFSLFGQAIALSGDRLFVGAHRTTLGGVVSRGVVHEYLREGRAWVHQGVIEPERSVRPESFGFSLDYRDGDLLVGATEADGLVVQSGLSFLFVDGADGWVERARLVGGSGVTHGWHGASVALGDGFAASQDWDIVSSGGVGHTDVWDRSGPPQVDVAWVLKSGSGLVLLHADGGLDAESYLLHEGALGLFDSHAPTDCGRAGRSLGSGLRELTWEPGEGSRYVLLGAMSAGLAGPIGTSSEGVERPRSAPEGCGDD